MTSRRDIDWPTVAVALAGLGWGTWYVVATRLNPIDEPQSAWLITPILIAIWLVAPFVVLSAFGPLPDRLSIDPDEGLDRPNRAAFVIGLPLLTVAIWLMGFVAAVIVYAPLSLLAMGERRLAVHATVLAILGALFVGFLWGLGVDLPLFPGDVR